MGMKCPGCGGGPKSPIYQCDNCHDTRCTNGNCPGTMGGRKGGGTNNGRCKACGKGKYQKID
ncbi:MAG: hypothetical protein IEMM0008_1838 [bacterium]|nr:MAG: hypothetical protein IEMM0008_1838 [bacterium]